MGDGLKRAAAAATRTRADAGLTNEMRDFLRVLSSFTQPETRKAIGPVVNRAEERARAACRRFGYAKMERRSDGKWGWRITSAGLRAMQ